VPAGPPLPSPAVVPATPCAGTPEETSAAETPEQASASKKQVEQPAHRVTDEAPILTELPRVVDPVPTTAMVGGEDFTDVHVVVSLSRAAPAAAVAPQSPGLAVPDVPVLPVTPPAPPSVPPVAPMPPAPVAPASASASGTSASGTGQQQGLAGLPLGILGGEIAFLPAQVSAAIESGIAGAVGGGADRPGSRPD
jgi:hypothetical protein